MAKRAGLSFQSPALQSTGYSIEEALNPHSGPSPTASVGLGGLAPSLADMAVTGQRLVEQSQFTMPSVRPPARPSGPAIGVDRTTGELFVQGKVFRPDDAASALETEPLLSQPAMAEMPSNFSRIPLQGYQAYLQSIKNPSMGRLFSKNVDIGVANLKQLAGGALAFGGAEETGARLMAEAKQEQEKLAPFQRQFTDVENTDDFGEWFVGNFGQQVPNLLESLAVALAGAAMGTAVGGPFGTVGGFFGGLLAKQGVKNAVTTAARKKLAGKALDDAERKLLNQVGGATAATFASSYGMGVGDIYSEQLEAGAPNRAATALSALPYAAAESVGELFIGSRLLGGATGKVLKDIPTTLGKAAEIGKRAGVGVGVGGALEGTTEAVQEALLIANNPEVDFDSPEAINRFINSFAAGAAIGGTLGGGANVIAKRTPPEVTVDPNQPSNLLNSGDNPTVPAQQLDLFANTEFAPIAGPAAPPDVSVPLTTTFEDETLPDWLRGPETTYEQETTLPEVPQMILPGMGMPPSGVVTGVPGAGGNLAQGVLNIFPEDLTPQELTGRMMPPAPTELPLPAVPQQMQGPEVFLGSPTVQSPQQGAFQFAPPPPPGTFGLDEPRQQPTELGLRLGEALTNYQRAQEYAAAEAELEAQRQADYDRAQRQRELQLAQQDIQANLQADLPAGPTAQAAPAIIPEDQQAGQLSLPVDTRQTKAQRKKGAAALRRAIRKEQENEAAAQQAARQAVQPTTQQDITPAERQDLLRTARQAGQLPLITMAGEPSVAATGKQRLRRGRAAPVKAAPVEAAPVDVEAAPVEAVDVEAVDAAPAGDQNLRRGKKVDTTVKERPNAVEEGKQPPIDQSKRGGVDEVVREDGETRVEPTSVEEEGAAAGGRNIPKRSKEQKRLDDLVELYEEIRDDEDTYNLAVEGILRTAYQPTPEERAQGVNLEALRVAREIPRVPAYSEALAKLGLDESSLTEGLTLPDTLANAIVAVEEAKDENEYNEALITVMEYAFTPTSNMRKGGLDKKAIDFLTNPDEPIAIDDAYRDALLELVTFRDSFPAVVERGENRGQLSPLFEAVVNAGVLNEAKRLTTIRGLPEQYADGNVQGPKQTTNESKDDARKNPATKLADEIAEINARTGQPTAAQREKILDKLRDLYANLYDDTAVSKDGRLLRNFFTADGEPKINTINGMMRVVTDVQSKKQQRITEAEARAAAIDAAAMAAIENNALTLEEWNSYNRSDPNNDGMYATLDGTPITRPLPVGKIKLVISSFLKKLKNPPKVYVFRNQADLQRKNPRLYEEAVAARPQNDFDTAPAVGYAFGKNNVIIFTDRVLTERQLKFVIAHETLGHVGFRGILTDKELNAALDKIYDESIEIRNRADQAVEARGISKREATEEVLADMAGTLETNILARFWNMIKNGLNKIGIEFDDDYARYLLSQSRRYVRNGDLGGQMFIPSDMAARMKAFEGMQDPLGTGRYSLTYADLGRIAGGYNAIGENSGLTGAAAIFESLRNKKINFKDLSERVLSEVKTMNFSARDNMGYRELFKILRDTVQKVNVLRNKYNHMMRNTLRPSGELFGFQFTSGATKEDLAKAGEMLRATSSMLSTKMTEAQLRNLPNLVQFVNGKAQIDQEAFDTLSEQGRLTVEDFQNENGLTYTTTDRVPMDDEGRQKLTAERDLELQYAQTDKERAAINKMYDQLLNAESYDKEVERTLDPMPDLTEDSMIWTIYNEVRDTMNQSAVDLLLANYAAASGERVASRKRVERALDRKLTEEDDVFLGTIEDMYNRIRNKNSTVNSKGETVYDRESVGNANRFIEDFNRAVIGKDTDRIDTLAEYFPEPDRTGIKDGVNGLRFGSKISEKKKFAIQQDIQNLALFEVAKSEADLHAKSTIARGYVPFGREGGFQVRMQAVDPETGKIYKINELYRQSLPYFQVDNRAEAEALGSRVQDLFDLEGGIELEVLVDGEFKVMPVKLVAQVETARLEQSTYTETNLNELISTLNRFNVNITPRERENLVVGLTTQNNRARTRLQRQGVPGEDKDTIKYVSQHLESVASTVARKENRHRLDMLFDEGSAESNKLWYGDQATYDRLKAEYERISQDPSASEAAKQRAKREFDDYHYTFVTKESQVYGNRFRDRAMRSVEFLDSQRSIEYSDFGSGDFASSIKMATVLMQLGGSVATGALNMVALATNVLPALTSYNSKKAFGGGFGYGKSSAAIFGAMNDVGAPSKADSDYYANLLQDNDALKASGLTRQEAQFMYDQTSAGTFQAALFNSLLGSARGKVTSGRAQKAIQTWMSMFSYTEQASRRATGLASFRLRYKQSLEAGMSEQEAYKDASDFSVNMVEQTLGEYAMFNRPAFFRGDVRQFIFMYKMFVVSSVQMLTAMDATGRLVMLGTLMFLSGVKGLPFADDLFDLLDTVAQILGLKVGSSELAFAKMLDDIAPGMTPALMRGFIDNFSPATISSRVSLGDMIPGTGMALAGADMGRELIGIAGPVASAIQGSVVFASDAFKYGLGGLGLSEQKKSFTDIMRESPVTMMRALGDSMSYTATGAITNRKGYVVSEDLTNMTILSRMLGFYPSAATRENDVIRISKRMSDYANDVKASYRIAYVQARLQKDNAAANKIIREVREWNKAARGTGLEMRDFVSSANRALREARRPATARYLKSAPKNIRPISNQIYDLYGVGG